MIQSKAKMSWFKASSDPLLQHPKTMMLYRLECSSGGSARFAVEINVVIKETRTHPQVTGRSWTTQADRFSHTIARILVSHPSSM